MNLTKLFEAQKVLRDKIAYNEPDRFNKLILALLVELGECANCWRGFKFWSVDQMPRDRVFRTIDVDMKVLTNPLLEEYVDGLHLVLELGLEINFNRELLPSIVPDNTLDQFNELYYQVSSFAQFNEEYGNSCGLHDFYDDLFGNYINLGILLGFTWEEVESAYFDKNKVNHERQDSGVY